MEVSCCDEGVIVDDLLCFVRNFHCDYESKHFQRLIKENFDPETISQSAQILRRNSDLIENWSDDLDHILKFFRLAPQIMPLFASANLKALPLKFPGPLGSQDIDTLLVELSALAVSRSIGDQNILKVKQVIQNAIDQLKNISLGSHECLKSEGSGVSAVQKSPKCAPPNATTLSTPMTNGGGHHTPTPGRTLEAAINSLRQRGAQREQDKKRQNEQKPINQSKVQKIEQKPAAIMNGMKVMPPLPTLAQQIGNPANFGLNPFELFRQMMLQQQNIAWHQLHQLKTSSSASLPNVSPAPPPVTNPPASLPPHPINQSSSVQKSPQRRRKTIPHLRKQQQPPPVEQDSGVADLSLGSPVQGTIKGRSKSGNVWVCPHLNCQKTFNNKFLLKKHVFIHTGQRPHQCCYCGKKFNRKDNLLRHKKTHLANASQHSRRHTLVFGVKPGSTAEPKPEPDAEVSCPLPTMVVTPPETTDQ